MHKLLIPTSKHLEDIPNKTFINLVRCLQKEASGKFEVIVQDENDCDDIGSVDFIISVRGVGWNVKIPGATTAVFWDDLHWNTEKRRRARHNLFHNADIILLPYYRNFLTIKEYQKYKSKALWCPFFVPDTALYCNTPLKQRSQKILVSGRCTDHYPLRQIIRKYAIEHPELFHVLEHPGYRNLTHQVVGENFYKLASSFNATVVTSAAIPLDYAVAKYFEMPACGCVPFMEELPDLHDLGFKSGINYIPISTFQHTGLAVVLQV